jgi:squalene-associated FAD-dependent desaturase
MAGGTIHIIGAGLSGLSAAVTLADKGRRVVVHELARYAGGRCRSYFEPVLGMTIDNGNHLVLSANEGALSYLKTIGAAHMLPLPKEAAFPFADLKTGARWVLRPNAGRLPWWILSEKRRVPGTKAGDYLSLARLLTPSRTATVTDVVKPTGPLYDKLWNPVLLSALNTDLSEASAALAGAVVRETLAKGGKACRPLVAAEGLGPVFVDPALKYLAAKGAGVRFDHQVRKLEIGERGVTRLDFGDDTVEIGPNDTVIVAVPAWVAQLLLPGLSAPTEFRAIVNLHYKAEAPADFPRILGVVNGTTEWLFAFPGRLSVTVSAADRLIEAEREPLAREVWGEIQKLTGLKQAMPEWQIVKERRATFAATPQENAKRPGAKTQWPNLFLAGDFTQTGLPATIEGSIRSGRTAAELALARRI